MCVAEQLNSQNPNLQRRGKQAIGPRAFRRFGGSNYHSGRSRYVIFSEEVAAVGTSKIGPTGDRVHRASKSGVKRAF